VYPREFEAAIAHALKWRGWWTWPLIIMVGVFGAKAIGTILVPGRDRSLVIPFAGTALIASALLIRHATVCAYRHLLELLEGRMCECGYLVEGKEQCPECGRAVPPAKSGKAQAQQAPSQ
jgi:hypothetical protein